MPILNLTLSQVDVLKIIFLVTRANIMPKINKEKHLYEDFFKNIFNDYFSYKSTCTNRVKKAHEFNLRAFSTRNFSVVFTGKKRTKLTKTRTTS